MSEIKPTCREDVTKRILHQKVQLQKKWRDLAEQLNQSVAWVVAACLGQMQLTEEQSQVVCTFFALEGVEWQRWLQAIPHKNPTNGKIPSDPLLYRMHEALCVYGPALKEVVHEEFGDGVVSAIDFSVKVEREPHPAGDRVKFIWSGKFLPYKNF